MPEVNPVRKPPLFMAGLSNGVNIKRMWLLLLVTIFISTAVIVMDSFRDDDFSRFDSPLYTDISQNMLRTGDWFTLRDSHGTNYSSEHPPLVFWVTALNLELFGESVFSAVLFSMLCAVLTCVVVFSIGTILKSDIVGFFSSMGLLLTRYIPRVARHNTIEVPLMFFVALAVLFIILAQKKHKVFYLFFGVSTALAVLTKGVVGLAPLGILILAIIIQKKFQDIWNPFFLLGLLAFIFLSSVWFFIKGGMSLVGIKSALYAYANFVSFAFNKASQIDPGSRIRFITRLFEFCFLITPGVLLGIYFVIMDTVKEKRRDLLIIPIWAIVFIAAFLFSKWRTGLYLLPMYPALAILFGIGLYEIISKNYRMYAVCLLIAFFMGNISSPFLFPHWEPKNVQEVIFANTYIPGAREALKALTSQFPQGVRYILSPGEDESAFSFFFGSSYKLEFCKDWEEFKNLAASDSPIIFFISNKAFSRIDKALHKKLKIVYSYSNQLIVTNQMDSVPVF